LIAGKFLKKEMTMKKQLLIILIITIVLAMGFVVESTGGATNTTSHSPATSTATVTSKITATPTLSVSSSPAPKALIPTEIHENKWASMAMSNGIVRGQEYFMGWYIYVPGHVNDHRVCGQWANFYIDDQPAGGEWQKWDYINGGGLYCAVSVGLHLNSADTAKLSPGVHTLKVDYLGDYTYAPSQWASTFVVRNP
jgi:hypothetical protein